MELMKIPAFILCFAGGHFIGPALDADTTDWRSICIATNLVGSAVIWMAIYEAIRYHRKLKKLTDIVGLQIKMANKYGLHVIRHTENTKDARDSLQTLSMEQDEVTAYVKASFPAYDRVLKKPTTDKGDQK